MEIMPWGPELDVNVPSMNEQHKQILSLMNELYDLHHKNSHYDEMFPVLEKLVHTTQSHFKDEEAYMKSINFEGLEPHKLIHENLLKDLSEHLMNFKVTRRLDDSFFTFLKVWLSAHIKGIDKKYGEKTT
ncbi:MAG: hemerythrin family protein [Halobacteriovoraceae bacterium]|nr:hemerythrin family protein [Halobacteriovoraceae bacterium]